MVRRYFFNWFHLLTRRKSGHPIFYAHFRGASFIAFSFRSSADAFALAIPSANFV